MVQLPRTISYEHHRRSYQRGRAIRQDQADRRFWRTPSPFDGKWKLSLVGAAMSTSGDSALLEQRPPLKEPRPQYLETAQFAFARDILAKSFLSFPILVIF